LTLCKNSRSASLRFAWHIRPLPALLHFQHKPTCKKSISLSPSVEKRGFVPFEKWVLWERTGKRLARPFHSLSESHISRKLFNSEFVHVKNTKVKKKVCCGKGTFSGLRWPSPPSSSSACVRTHARAAFRAGS
jgi:hypothetical protein